MMTTHKTDSVSDISKGGWIDRFVPLPLQPYCRLARLDRPIGTWLLLLPCWWGVALANGTLVDRQWPELRLLALFAVGSLAMRGAGCTWNDLVDRDYDARVARTADRPLPSGAVTVRAAVAFLILQLLLGLAVLLQFNTFTIMLGIAAMVLVVAYPFMKRVTYWPQAFLGLTFNWGALVGWTAVKGSLGWPALLLYAAGFAWTLGYDTIYAHQDKEDDALVGIKSSAIKLGAETKRYLWFFYGAALVLLSLSGVAAGVTWTYALALIGAAIGFIWQIVFVDLDDARNCLTKFRSNRLVGLIVFVGLVLA
jgi:4-hydroxybenzoate polyprenyltransferase